MISKSLIISAVLLIGSITPQSSQAQHLDPTDAGISVFNYKHANKAAMAKKKGDGSLVTQTVAVATVQNQPRFSKTNNRDYTPRYTARTVSFVIYVEEKKQKANINPLLSVRNYKTNNTKQTLPQTEGFLCQSI